MALDRQSSRMVHEKRGDATERNVRNRKKCKDRKAKGVYDYKWSRVGSKIAIQTGEVGV